MSNDTVQFAVRALVLTICAAVLGILAIDGTAIFYFGDGEAYTLIGQLNGPLVAAFTALGSSAVLHPVVSWLLARLSGQPVATLTPGSSVQLAPSAVSVALPLAGSTLTNEAPASVATGSGV